MNVVLKIDFHLIRNHYFRHNLLLCRSFIIIILCIIFYLGRINLVILINKITQLREILLGIPTVY